MSAAALLALLYALDPWDASWGAESIAALKYLPVELTVAALPLLLVGRWWRVLLNRSALSLALFVTLVLAGSAVTIRQGHALDESYVARGLGILPFFPALLLFSNAEMAARFSRAIRWPLTLAPLWFALLTAAWRAHLYDTGQPNIFHEQVFLTTCGALAAFVFVRTRVFRWAIIGTATLGALLTSKNTGFIALAICYALMAYIIWAPLHERPRKQELLLRRAALVLASAAALFGAIVLVVFFRDLLPSGSPDVRLRTYAIRVLQFIHSPVYGQWWVGSPLIQLPNKAGTFLEPSHSDVLDILAYGGVLGFGLFAYPVLTLLFKARRSLRAFAAQGDAFGAFAVGTILTFGFEMTFNPMWGQPKLVPFFWMSLAYVATRGVNKPKKPRRRWRLHRVHGERGVQLQRVPVSR